MAEGQLKEVRASRHGPRLNYLFFADDLLFLKRVIKEGLQRFRYCLGQKINFLKSTMLCSPNVPEEEARRLSAFLGVPLTLKLGKYLGAPHRDEGKR